jgi:C-terminal processing protease CtpA/Prc
MHYHNKFLLLLLLSAPISAEEKGSIGFSAEVSVSGFFSPELTEVKVKEVFVDSPAQQAGLVAGEKILSIDGCQIPGCSASKAKKLMARQVGEILPLRIEKLDGTQVDIVIHVQ